MFTKLIYHSFFFLFFFVLRNITEKKCNTLHHWKSSHSALMWNHCEIRKTWTVIGWIGPPLLTWSDLRHKKMNTEKFFNSTCRFFLGFFYFSPIPRKFRVFDKKRRIKQFSFLPVPVSSLDTLGLWLVRWIDFSSRSHL